jgi:dihydroxy-acid dehydratase
MLTKDDAVKKMFRAGPAGIRTTQAFSQTAAGIPG